MGEYLAKCGHSVVGVRLAGHATQPADMARLCWWDWLACVEDGINLLKHCTDQVYVIGLSMGGILTLVSAARYPIRGAVALSTPAYLPSDWRWSWIKLLSKFVPEVDKGEPDWHDPETFKDHVSYPRFPTPGLAQLRDLITEMRSSLPQIKIPVLLMQSHNDHGIPGDSMPILFNELGTPDKEMQWVEDSGHILTRDREHIRVFEAAQAFIQKFNH